MLLKQHTTDRGFMEAELQNHFTGTIFYEIELTAKYCKMLGAQIFEDIDAGISIEEFSTLDTILCNPEICQRDLAKLILKDRANTGKILDNLENLGLIERELSVKNNRPVKISRLTPKGKEKVIEISEVLKPHTDMIKSRILNSDLKQLKNMLQEFRDVMNESLEIKI